MTKKALGIWSEKQTKGRILREGGKGEEQAEGGLGKADVEPRWIYIPPLRQGRTGPVGAMAWLKCSGVPTGAGTSRARCRGAVGTRHLVLLLKLRLRPPLIRLMLTRLGFYVGALLPCLVPINTIRAEA